MINIKKYKTPIIIIFCVIIVLAIMLSIGYTIGFLSEDLDGLERVVEDAGVSETKNIWTPILSWIENNYIAGIVGIVLISTIVGGFFYLNTHQKNKKVK